MQRFEVTVTEHDLAPVDHPAASKCKCKCGYAERSAVPSAPDVRVSGEGAPHGQACLSPLGE